MQRPGVVLVPPPRPASAPPAKAEHHSCAPEAHGNGMSIANGASFLFLRIVCALVLWTSPAIGEGIYPQGTDFPLGLYAINSSEEMNSVRQCGWNIAHTYAFVPEFLTTSREAGMRAMASLPSWRRGFREADAEAIIGTLSANDNLVWWNLPEEQRWWRSNEMGMVTNYFKWTRNHDPRRRPNYMYLPSHYREDDIKRYVPFLDIVPMSLYTTHTSQPHAWVRWRVETTIKGIELANARVGQNYLGGEKTPVGIVELFHQPTKGGGMRIMSPQGAYHDSWQAIVSGARGIMMFSYSRRDDVPSFKTNWEIYCKVASQLSGAEKLGQVILYGDDLRTVDFTITSGPQETGIFRPHGSMEDKTFPSVDILAKDWMGSIYVIAVNSAELPVSGDLTGLPATAERASLLFDGGVKPVIGGSLSFDLEPLGVKIFKMPRVTAERASSSLHP